MARLFERFTKHFLIGLLICTGCISGIFAQNSADFFISASYENLTIYNRYQQRISGDEIRQNFAKLQPLQIEERQTKLSDGFTDCMKVRLGRNTFFIATDEDGAPKFSNQPAEFAFLENCNLLGDTVSVLQNGEIFIAQDLAYPNIGDDRKIFLATGEQFVRLFEWQRQIFAKQPENPVLFGWTNLPKRGEGSSWEIRAAEKLPKKSPAAEKSFFEVQQFVEMQTGEINRVLTRLFGYFNEKKGENRTPPQWETTTENEQIIRCKFINSSDIDRFNESSRYLFIRLENYLLNSGFSVAMSGSEIVIRRKT